MQSITTIGLDIAKSVFQVHGVGADGQVVVRRQLKRRYVLVFFQKLPPCLVGIEACASAHHWSRELQALGHTVKLMPPAYVKPYVKRHKNDAADAEAICEAVTRANMRFVATKTPEQQSCLTLHRTRHLLMRQQTAVINAIRSHLAEFGIIAPVGRNGVEQLLGVVADLNDKRLPEIARACVAALGVPTLVLHCRGDLRSPFALGQEIAAGIPGAKFVPLDGKNHVLLPNEPAHHKLFEAVADFLGDRPFKGALPGSTKLRDRLDNALRSAEQNWITKLVIILAAVTGIIIFGFELWRILARH
jgi:hypothetical protein